MLKLFTGINKAVKVGQYLTLLVDTMNYFKEEAIKRGLSPDAQIIVKDAE